MEMVFEGSCFHNLLLDEVSLISCSRLFQFYPVSFRVIAAAPSTNCFLERFLGVKQIAPVAEIGPVGLVSTDCLSIGRFTERGRLFR